MRDIIQKFVMGEDLTAPESEIAMELIMTQQATEAQIGAFLIGLRMKGETIEEITEFVKVMRRFSVKVNPHVKGTIVDTCGSGGDVTDTFNISTTAAIVAAAAGANVAKHGNRSVSSQSGSADILERLGVNIELEAKGVERCIERCSIGFMYAPLFHPAMKYVAKPRREVGMRTVFNLLGPLTNPASVKAQVYGIYKPELTEALTRVLKNLGSDHTLVVHGMDGLDEFSTLGKTKVSELKDGKIKTYFVRPEDFGLKQVSGQEISGGTPEENARITLNILMGHFGPKRDIVLLNSGALLMVAGLADDIAHGVELSKDAIDSGAASRKLRDFIKISNK